MAAVLVLENVPNSCRTCMISRNESNVLEEAYVCPICNKWVIDKELDKRPEWCPITLKKICEEK